MKKTVLFLLISLASLSLSAQRYLGGSIAILDYPEIGTYVNIAPEFGYNINEKWAVAGVVSFTHMNSTSAFSFTPYAQYTFYRKGLFSLFLDGRPELSVSEGDVGFGIVLMPGIQIRANERISFLARYGFLGYRDHVFDDVSGLNLGTNTLSIGFIVHL
ncbi:hypothetical protein M2459_000561 [Parabacteroides sp. PF5-5]|uniref:outer membrane beta-barrel protein n=1 Tax=unclassified Parabacteroides TaxID=2649774 RepID=UPI002473B7F1|nr:MULTISPECIES: outer membrane beta-barrel protein [unclassified Parabacteroides]MDH6303506.1 hypothetical protein [Parabacteroides sp. PH5-39]MDH6314828.1 hypothetical protein [Parabacteroides sp. PF5-13]MDH6318165.1 hypothetical protein [Parabacteroides sp. PH5-13]MDH6321903.1 hypothetical protein [Parabacteroides sp. PH5-8]MDH6326027.1 hypothetical protein [Parabacteroides sp. PH5-41]